jgi:hypothetical protein
MKLFETVDAMDAKTYIDLDDLHIVIIPSALAPGDQLTLIGVTNCSFKVKRAEAMRIVDAWRARAKELTDRYTPPPLMM